ncbi:MAG: hypothetical protein II232_07185 [Spirochaetaceae bacterium]|nr:hypothetical protein [Spirochaetaceae bacterium]
MKILPKLFFVSLLFLCFSCSENINLEKIDSGFMIPAPSQTSDMKLLARSSTEDSLLLTVNLLNADDNSVIDNFSTSCVPEELISVQLEAEKGDKVCVEIIFSDINIPDLIWAYGKSESVVLSDKQTDISVELEYYDLAFYLTQNPFELIVTNEAGNKITKKSASGNYIVNSTDVLYVSVSNLDILGEVDPTYSPYSISWTFNGESSNLHGENINFTVGSQQGILPENNILQAIIEITNVGKFNASFVFDVEIN